MPASADLTGVFPPLLTPTDPDDCIDEAALRGSIRRLLGAGVAGLFVGGTAGEGPLLVEREWDRLMEIAFDETAGRAPLLGGAQDCSTQKVVRKVAHLRRIGYRHCVVTPTFYVGSKTADEQLRLFAACREAAGDMEVIAYNIPQVTGTAISVETFCELARRGWIRHCKESSGDLDFLRRLVREAGAYGLRVLMGDERSAAAGLLAGAVGLVNVCANLEPRVYVRLCQAAARRDEAEAQRLQAHIDRLVDTVVLSGPCFVAGPKYFLSRLGLGRGVPVSPLQPVSPEQARAIDDYLSSGQAGEDGGRWS